MKHKHYDLIEEWARTGKRVQFQKNNGEWLDVPNPNWIDNVEYRFKPETIKYKRYLIKSVSGKFAVWVQNYNMDTDVSKHDNFVKWIDTEWQEVEI